MFHHVFLRKKIFLCILWIMVPGLFKTITIKAQERFLLTEAEMPDFELIRQTNFTWIIDEGILTHNVIKQTWRTSGIDSQYFSIQYCEFDNEIAAIQGTAYASHTFATPFKWGSPNGSIFGDATWTAITNTSLFFVRGNVGIMVNADDPAILISTSKKALNKIELNLSPAVLSFEELVRQKQIPMSNYQTITNPVLQSAMMNGFSLYTIWDSKWLTDSVSMAMGIRKEWKNEKDAIVSIDICKYDTDALAQKAVDIRSRSIWTSRVYDLDHLDSLKSIVLNFKAINKKKISYFMLGIKNNITVHFYHFNPDSVDWDFFYAVAEKLSEQIVNF